MASNFEFYSPTRVIFGKGTEQRVGALVREYGGTRVLIVYGRSQTAFSEDGLPIGAGLDDLGKGLRSMTGTIFSTKEKGVRYLELTEGYINKLAVDANGEVIGYQFVKLGKMMEDIRHGKTPNEAYEKNVGTYGRFSKEAGAVKYIDPREE